MLRTGQAPNKTVLQDKGDGYNLVDWYLDVPRKYHEPLPGIARYVLPDAWLSKARFINELCNMGFRLISRLRDDAALWYAHVEARTGKRGVDWLAQRQQDSIL